MTNPVNALRVRFQHNTCAVPALFVTICQKNKYSRPPSGLSRLPCGLPPHCELPSRCCPGRGQRVDHRVLDGHGGNSVSDPCKRVTCMPSFGVTASAAVRAGPPKQAYPPAALLDDFAE